MFSLFTFPLFTFPSPPFLTWCVLSFILWSLFSCQW
jgi:hypothetical protein